MKRSVIGLIIVFMIVGSLVVAGCGKKTVTVTTDEGTVTMDEEDGEVTITDEDEETTLSYTVPTEEEMGVSFYPGAEIEEEDCLKATGIEEGEEASIYSVTLLTKDSAPKVYEWYKGQLSGKPDFECVAMESADEEYGSLAFGTDGDYTGVWIGVDPEYYPGKTIITIEREIGGY